jgi:hypothetical protein
MAQPERMTKESRERIEAQRVAFITQQLDLSPEEAARFWPIYNSYKGELMDMRKDFERPDIESMTENEAVAQIEKQIQQEQRKLNMRAKMLSELRSAVSAKKVLMLQPAENMFNKELLRKLQENRKP